MTALELIHALRTTESRGKRKLLDAAADTIELQEARIKESEATRLFLMRCLSLAQQERDVAARRMIELEQTRRDTAFAHSLRGIEIGSRELLNLAADTIEDLAYRLSTTQDTRDTVTRRMIELERNTETPETLKGSNQ